MVLRLLNKVALITGGGSGIGRATSLRFSQEGAKIVIADISSRDGEETVREIRKRGGDALFIKTDVTKSDEVQAMIKETVKSYGKLNVLFNNAGIMSSGSILETSEEEWSKVINTNLTSIFLVSKYAVPEIIKSGGGSIINSGSVLSLVAMANNTVYCASKAAIYQLTRCMAIDLARHNIRVNCVCPGPVATPLYNSFMEKHPDLLQRDLDMIPLSRIAKPEEIASAVLYLASDESSYVTGTALAVDGGWTTQ